MSPLDVINQLKGEYSGSVVYGPHALVIHSATTFNNSGFIGSTHVVSLSAQSITHDAPACLAAPIVHMIARDAINLGVTACESSVPVRLFAIKQLSITTGHLSVGDLAFIGKPRFGSIYCKKLTLCQSTDEEPDHFEVIRSWAVNDSMEIEVTRSH